MVLKTPRSEASGMNCMPSPFSAYSSTFALLSATRSISGAKSFSLPRVYCLATTLPPSFAISGSAASNMRCGQSRSAPSRK